MMKKRISLAILYSIIVCFFTSCMPCGTKVDVNQAIGECPICKAEVVGEIAFCDGTDEQGTPISWTEYMAQCKCGAQLYSFDDADINSRILWQTYTDEDSNNGIDAHD